MNYMVCYYWISDEITALYKIYRIFCYGVCMREKLKTVWTNYPTKLRLFRQSSCS